LAGNVLIHRLGVSGRRAVVIVVLVILAAVSAACNSEAAPETFYFSGRSLEVHLQRPEIVDKVAYMDTSGQHRVIRSRATNRQLAVVNVTVVNRTSVITPVLVDETSARLGNRRGERINPLDPNTSAVAVDTADAEENKYVPLLWGQFELDRNMQVQGWMVFDVPKGLVLGTFWWDEVDTVIGDFIAY
jgi:hypothetical protein